MNPTESADFARSVIWARNAGYRDGYACERPNLPAWDTIPDWSNAYSEGYALGIAAARKAGRANLLKQRALF